MATFRMPVLGFSTAPDASGNAFFEPYSIKATNDIWKHLVLILNDSGTRIGVYGVFDVPQNYVGSAAIVIHWTATATTGDVEFDVDYRAISGDDAESLDQATAQESVNLNDTAPSAIHERMTCTLNLTSANIVAGDTVEFYFVRDGTDAGDTMAAAAIVHAVLFQFADA